MLDELNGSWVPDNRSYFDLTMQKSHKRLSHPLEKFSLDLGTNCI